MLEEITNNTQTLDALCGFGAGLSMAALIYESCRIYKFYKQTKQEKEILKNKSMGQTLYEEEK